jgi:hypothetical protein
MVYQILNVEYVKKCESYYISKHRSATCNIGGGRHTLIEVVGVELYKKFDEMSHKKNDLELLRFVMICKFSLIF